MIRLIRLVVSLMAIGVVVYFAVTVPLGTKTLWEHVRAIASTDESQELVEGVKAKAEEVLERDDARATDAVANDASGDGQPSDQIEPDEQKKLRKLIRKRLDGDQEGAKAVGSAEPQK